MVVGEIGGGFIAPGVVEIGYAVVASCWVAATRRKPFGRWSSGRAPFRGSNGSSATRRSIAPRAARVLAKAGFALIGEEEDEHEGVPIRVNRWELVLRPAPAS